MMNVDMFISMDFTEQLEVFWSGVRIGELCDGAFKMVCHQVDHFYVECKILGGHYLDIRVFSDPDLLEPYLNQVVIPNI